MSDASPLPSPLPAPPVKLPPYTPRDSQRHAWLGWTRDHAEVSRSARRAAAARWRQARAAPWVRRGGGAVPRC